MSQLLFNPIYHFKIKFTCLFKKKTNLVFRSTFGNSVQISQKVSYLRPWSLTLVLVFKKFSLHPKLHLLCTPYAIFAPPTPKLPTVTTPPHTENFKATTSYGKHIKISHANHLQLYGLSCNRLVDIMLYSRGI